mgnify:CR=1 FL=1
MFKKNPPSPEKSVIKNTRRKVTRIEGNETLDPNDIKHLEHLIDAIESLGLEEFIEYIKSPWRLLWPNFVAGVARWFWALIWATAVIAIIGWTLSTMIDLPLIWKRLEPYVVKVQTEFNRYIEQTDYKKHFESIEWLLRDIRDKQEKLQPKDTIIPPNASYPTP